MEGKSGKAIVILDQLGEEVPVGILQEEWGVVSSN